MIVTVVTFPLPAGMTEADARDLYAAGADRYRTVKGLVSKHYLFQPGTGGGVYLWETRADADALFTADWRRALADKYGAEPQVQYFVSPLSVINARADTA
ncbi:hypothetical protein [Azospirillum sp.]|uniref:hypothetical protein n=1 Tax=Azospirillum sp. TaxID=34012 RepID=UPI002D4EF4D2|nr:hypothetical protein [Azospirillum sp.]HYD68379.1 hypothetical protein [Azospirillum sp.]